LEVNNYEAIRQIVSGAGQSIPENQTDTRIDDFQYETTAQESYILRVNIDDNDRYFFTLYPDGIIEICKHDPIDTKLAMEFVRMLLYMDRALKERELTEYFSYYATQATIHISHKTYKGSRPDFTSKELTSIVCEDLDVYTESLTDFYINAFPEYRKREEIFIEGNDQNWEVHSSYIEEGTIEGQKYRKDGRSIYGIALSERPKYIVSDESFAFIYLLED
jgi:hypothetical protein